jgi:hypothetical protein
LIKWETEPRTRNLGTSPAPGPINFIPKIGEAIAPEAEKLGLTQGLMIEEMWDIYTLYK